MGGELDFNGKTALVTGAASGIGAACAAWLARQGAKRLILIDLNDEGLERLGLDCEVASFSGNVADPALWDRIEGEAGAIDHAVLNAGIASGGPVVDLPLEEWRRVLSVNLDGAFLSLRTALRLMTDGGSRWSQRPSRASAPNRTLVSMLHPRRP